VQDIVRNRASPRKVDDDLADHRCELEAVSTGWGERGISSPASKLHEVPGDQHRAGEVLLHLLAQAFVAVLRIGRWQKVSQHDGFDIGARRQFAPGLQMAACFGAAEGSRVWPSRSRHLH
jgi:hypothetical protein